MRAWLAIAALLALIRLPFLWTPIQGDDPYYLFGAEHAQIDPLHPSHARYVFQGKEVDMRGHPHPPGNAWFLAAALALRGDIDEPSFHAFYLLWSLIAAAAAYSLARRFSSVPLWPTLLFLATPAFVINGNSLESDVPFVACWLAAFALFIRAVDTARRRWLAASILSFAAAALFAYQSIAAIPILAIYLYQRRRSWLAAWAVLLTPAAVIGFYQLFERLSSGALPAQVLTGYFTQYGLQSVVNKLRNAAMLTIHMAWILFPALPLLAWRKGKSPSPTSATPPAIPNTASATNPTAIATAPNASPAPTTATPAALPATASATPTATSPTAAPHTTRHDHRFLQAWIALFFAFALAIFFAGSMRYLLPLVLPAAILVAERLRHRPSWLAAGLAAQLALSLALSFANYQHWAGYRDFIAQLRPHMKDRRVWVNGELGLRYYAESEGALPVTMSQAVRPGDLILSSRLAFPVPFTTGGGDLAPLAEQRITPTLPLQLIGIDAHSGYSAASMGFLPFGVTRAPVDIVRAELVLERKPVKMFLPMNAPDAEQHIVSGVYSLESNAWRWTAGRAVFLLKSPPQPTPLTAELRIYDQSPATRVTLQLDGETVAEAPATHGPLTLRTPPLSPKGPQATVTLTIDRTFQAGGDQRELGLILTSIGFAQP